MQEISKKAFDFFNKYSLLQTEKEHAKIVLHNPKFKKSLHKLKTAITKRTKDGALGFPPHTESSDMPTNPTIADPEFKSSLTTIKTAIINRIKTEEETLYPLYTKNPLMTEKERLSQHRKI